MLAVAASALPARAEGPWPRGAETAGGFFHEFWQTGSGLPDNTVPALLQTRDGYLWVGTQFGLARFDGVQFTAFNQGNTAALAANYVVGMVEDNEGGLWVATFVGLTRFKDGVWTRFSHPDELHAQMLSLLRGPSGTIWVGTARGLLRYDGANFHLVPGLAIKVRAIAELASGEVWVGSDAGTYRLRGDRLERVTAAEGGVDGPVLTLLAHSSGTLWAGTRAGLVRLARGPRQVRTTKDGLLGDVIDFLAEDKHARLWVGGPNGLVLFDRGVDVVPSVIGRWDGHEGLAPVHSLVEDREGNLWLGTESDGLHRLRDTAFSIYDRSAGLPDDFVFSLLPEADGDLWVGTRAGLTRLSNGQAFNVRGPDGKSLGITRSILRTRDGRLFSATHDGIWQIEGTSGRSLSGKDGFPEGRLYGLVEDRDGALWMGTEQGEVRWKDGKSSLWELADGEGPALPLVTAVDGGGRVWVGAQRGLYVFDGHTFKLFAGKDELRSDEVFSLLPDGDDLWVGASESGLSLVHAGKLTSLPLRQHHYTDGVVQLAEDGAGNLWMGTGQGLLRASKRQLVETALGQRKDFDVTLFDQRDGLRSAEFNGGGRSTSARTADGRLWFASARGLVVFDPLRSVRNTYVPPVHIERVLVDEQEVDLRKPLSFPPGRGRLEIQYTAPGLRVPDRVRFRYRLEGADEKWVDAGTRRTAVYAGLPGGTFRFRVQAANEEGTWNEAGAAIELKLMPHFTQTRLFYALLILAGLAAIFGVFRLRALQARRREAELEGVVEERTKELEEARDKLEERVKERTAQLAGELAERERLQSQLVQAQKLDSLGRMAGGVAHDLNNVLTAILGYAELLQESLRDEQARADIREISAAGGRAAALIRQLLAFARKQRSEPRVVSLDERITDLERMLRKLVPENIDLVLERTARAGHVRIDPSQLEQVVVNLVVNARDAMPQGGTLTIATAETTLHEPPPHAMTLKRGDYVVLTVTDTGSGMTDEVKRHLFEPFFTTKDRGKGTGLGLATCYGIVNQAGGVIGVRSVQGEGSTFEVWLPRARGEARSEPPPGPPQARGGREVILLAEDDEQVRSLGARVLREAGYTVLEAVDGINALETAQAWAGPINLLVTDVVMPRLGGPDLAARMLALRPGLKLVSSSGYAEPELPLGPLEGQPFLRKPFSGPQLLLKVRSTLDGTEQVEQAHAGVTH